MIPDHMNELFNYIDNCTLEWKIVDSIPNIQYGEIIRPIVRGHLICIQRTVLPDDVITLIIHASYPNWRILAGYCGLCGMEIFINNDKIESLLYCAGCLGKLRQLKVVKTHIGIQVTAENDRYMWLRDNNDNITSYVKAIYNLVDIISIRRTYSPILHRCAFCDNFIIAGNCECDGLIDGLISNHVEKYLLVNHYHRLYLPQDIVNEICYQIILIVEDI